MHYWNMIAIISKHWQNAESLLLIILLAITALAPSIPKALGIALVLAWLLTIVYSRNTPPSISIPRAWLVTLGITAILIAIRFVVAALHGDGLQERHFEAKWLLTTLAIFTLLRRQPTALASQHGETIWIATLTLFSLLGLLSALQAESRQLVTNAIPWATIMGVVSLALLTHTFYATTSHLKMISGLGVAAASLAIVASQTRGAYVALAITAVAFIWNAIRTRTARTLWIIFILVLLFSASFTTWTYENVYHRWLQAAQESNAAISNHPNATDTSIGARIILWRHAWESAKISGPMGIGIEARRELIRSWAEQYGSATLRSLGHVHQEHLNAWLDHGIAGLLVSLTTTLVPLVLGIFHCRLHPAAGWTLIGWSAVIGFGGLTNVNTAHNYFTSGVCLMWLLLVALRIQPALAAPSPNKHT